MLFLGIHAVKPFYAAVHTIVDRHVETFDDRSARRSLFTRDADAGLMHHVAHKILLRQVLELRSLALRSKIIPRQALTAASWF